MVGPNEAELDPDFHAETFDLEDDNAPLVEDDERKEGGNSVVYNWPSDLPE